MRIKISGSNAYDKLTCMKTALIFLLVTFFHATIVAQSPATISVEREQKIKKDIEKEISKLEIELKKAKVNILEIEFTLDTFRIELLYEKHIAIIYSDFGMRDANYETARLYDSLLNKYYKKLLATLKEDNKKVLIRAQKSWIIFRDTEFSLVETISKDEYAGGGTMQQLTESSAYLNLVKSRTVAIFDHYARATQNE